MGLITAVLGCRSGQIDGLFENVGAVALFISSLYGLLSRRLRLIAFSGRFVEIRFVVSAPF